jgi:glycosyltransferase involved in cell wall biosynthesis
VKQCSILVPAYNVEAYLEEALESAFAQTYPAIQVIVVNDGSTDRTAEVIAPYRDRITYVEQANGGLAAARNRALREATGDFVALLDADDVWVPTRLERLISFLDGHPEVGFVTSDAYLMNEREPSTTRYYDHYEFLLNGDPFGSPRQHYWILFGNFVMGMTVTRRELFARHGEFEPSLRTSEDWDMWIRFIQGGERVGLVPEPLCYYRIREGGLSRNLPQMYNDAVRVAERAARRLRPEDLRGLGVPMLRRGKQALALQKPRSAAVLFAAAGRDPELPLRKRLEALAFAAMPGPGNRWWNWKSRRAWAKRARSA